MQDIFQKNYAKNYAKIDFFSLLILKSDGIKGFFKGGIWIALST